jgi:Flp pilus assembly protein TadG
MKQLSLPVAGRGKATIMIGRAEAQLKASVTKIAEFASDRRAVAALEFALIAPLLLSMYFITMEVSQGIEANKKVGRVGSMVADLVSQQQATSVAELNAILAIGEATLQPYNRSQPTITITAINISDEATPDVTVAWSRKLENGSFGVGPAAGSTTTVPTALEIRGSFLIRVESELEYEPVITWAADNKTSLGLSAAFDGITMDEIYHLRPRMSQSIACTDC